MIHHGDCLDVMAGMEPESVDAIVTDPPYGLTSTGARGGFMGKVWDGTGVAFDVATWAAAYRVAKPSAYLLAFGGTRTVHRMTCAIEDAGWIVRDMLVWGYASGFPKSKASLKPAWEPIVMARKPGPLRPLAIDACRIGTATVSNVQPATARGYETGSHFDMLNVAGKKPYHYSDERRARAGEPSADRRYTEHGGTDIAALPGPRGGDAAGRWPSNLILTDPIFDGGWDGVVGNGLTSGQPGGPGRQESYSGGGVVDFTGDHPQGPLYFDAAAGPSRFFLVPKASRSDREPVLGGLAEREAFVTGGPPTQTYCPTCGNSWIKSDGFPSCGHGERAFRPTVNRPRANVHPTVKPLELMRHLVRLVTPTGGVVLDPFLGSGTTALAAEMEGFAWIGIEREAEYVAIAEARLNGTQQGMAL